MRSPVFQIVHFAGGNGNQLSLGETLQAVMSQPTDRWRHQFSGLSELGLSAAQFPGLAGGNPQVMTGVAALMQRFHAATLEPHWATMTQAAAWSVSQWTQTIALQGMEALLNSLHPDLHWDPPKLTIELRKWELCAPDCPHRAILRHRSRHGWLTAMRPSAQGLNVRPTLTSPFISVWEEGGPAGSDVMAISIPIVANPELLVHSQIDPLHTDPVARLLGSTRSWVLRACADQALTTSGLAEKVGISMASASEHASVLRAAGLIQSKRAGPAIWHRASTLGVSLMAHGPKRRRRLRARSAWVLGSDPFHRWSPAEWQTWRRISRCLGEGRDGACRQRSGRRVAWCNRGGVLAGDRQPYAASHDPSATPGSLPELPDMRSANFETPASKLRATSRRPAEILRTESHAV
jgi:hypothetical protein